MARNCHPVLKHGAITAKAEKGRERPYKSRVSPTRNREPYGSCGVLSSLRRTCMVCQARVTKLSIVIRCAVSADTPESGIDVAALVCQRLPLSGIDEGTVFTGELDTIGSAIHATVVFLPIPVGEPIGAFILFQRIPSGLERAFRRFGGILGRMHGNRPCTRDQQTCRQTEQCEECALLSHKGFDCTATRWLHCNSAQTRE